MDNNLKKFRTLLAKIKKATPTNSTVKLPKNINTADGTFEKMDIFRKKYAYAIPNMRSLYLIKHFAENQQILEVFSGQALWAYLLQLINVNVIATDLEIEKKTYTSVEKMDALKAVIKYKTNILMMIWPPCGDPIAYKTLQRFKGDKVIYIGEGDDGCTGDEKFHKLLSTKYELVANYKIKRWPGFYDSLYLYVHI